MSSLCPKECLRHVLFIQPLCATDQHPWTLGSFLPQTIPTYNLTSTSYWAVHELGRLCMSTGRGHIEYAHALIIA